MLRPEVFVAEVSAGIPELDRKETGLLGRIGGTDFALPSFSIGFVDDSDVPKSDIDLGIKVLCDECMLSSGPSSKSINVPMVGPSLVCGVISVAVLVGNGGLVSGISFRSVLELLLSPGRPRLRWLFPFPL